MSARVPERIGAFRCPKCGNDGSNGPLLFLEDITCYRPVLGVKNGVLEIDSLYRTDGYDDGGNARFECRGRINAEEGRVDECEHKWAVPRWLGKLIDWV